MTENNAQSLIDIMMNYHHLDTNDQNKRLIAVTAALEIINSDAQGGKADISAELKNLGRYADCIQKAMLAEK